MSVESNSGLKSISFVFFFSSFGVFGIIIVFVCDCETECVYTETLIRDIEIDETSQTECRYRASIALDWARELSSHCAVDTNRIWKSFVS